jgi:hypothetical protein
MLAITRSITLAPSWMTKPEPRGERLTPTDGQHLHGGDPVGGEPSKRRGDEACSKPSTAMVRVHDKVVEPREVQPIRPHGQCADRPPVQPPGCDEVRVRKRGTRISGAPPEVVLGDPVQSDPLVEREVLVESHPHARVSIRYCPVARQHLNSMTCPLVYRVVPSPALQGKLPFSERGSIISRSPPRGRDRDWLRTTKAARTKGRE